MGEVPTLAPGGAARARAACLFALCSAYKAVEGGKGSLFPVVPPPPFVGALVLLWLLRACVRLSTHTYTLAASATKQVIF